MNYKVLFLLIVVICCIPIIVSADNVTIRAPHNMMANWTTRDVYQGGTVYWYETVDLSRVEGWYGKVYRENNYENQIDISSFTNHIIIDPIVFPEGMYFQWSPFEEPNANTEAFFVQAYNTTPVYNISFPNFTGVNVTQVLEVRLPLERKPVSDILIARGDSLHYENPMITNTSSVWIFGRIGKQYALPCEDGFVEINDSLILPLEPGTYDFIIFNTGKNLVPEVLYDNETETIYSPFIHKPELEIKGMAPSVVLAKLIPWIRKNTDDQVISLKIEVGDPYLEITTIDMQYYAIDSLHISGYTNMKNQSRIYVTIDEDNLTAPILKPTRFYTEAVSISIGEMRQFVVNAPFDEENTTVGLHTITAHGDYGAWASVQYRVYSMPEGQERPRNIIKYVGGYEFRPTPTPITIVQKEMVTQQIIQKEMVMVPPSDEQVKAAQDLVIKGYLIVGVSTIILIAAGVLLARYLWGVMRRARVG